MTAQFARKSRPAWWGRHSACAGPSAPHGRAEENRLKPGAQAVGLPHQEPATFITIGGRLGAIPTPLRRAARRRTSIISVLPRRDSEGAVSANCEISGALH